MHDLDFDKLVDDVKRALGSHPSAPIVVQVPLRDIVRAVLDTAGKPYEDRRYKRDNGFDVRRGWQFNNRIVWLDKDYG